MQFGKLIFYTVLKLTLCSLTFQHCGKYPCTIHFGTINQINLVGIKSYYGLYCRSDYDIKKQIACSSSAYIFRTAMKKVWEVLRARDSYFYIVALVINTINFNTLCFQL